MIQRFCFVKLSDGETAARPRIARELRDQLVAAIAGAGAGAQVTIGVPADASAARWDLSIVIELGSLEAWTALAEHPAFAAVLDQLAARATVVKAWTFSALP